MTLVTVTVSCLLVSVQDLLNLPFSNGRRVILGRLLVLITRQPRSLFCKLEFCHNMAFCYDVRLGFLRQARELSLLETARPGWWVWVCGTFCGLLLAHPSLCPALHSL